MTNINAQKAIGRHGYKNPTANEAVRNVVVKAAVEEANRKGNRTMSLEIDRIHHEYTIIYTDSKGHVTRVGRTYDDEREIPVII